MAGQPRDAEEVREFRLEGAGLFVIGGLLVAALAGAFYLGRWYERSVTPPAGSAAERTDPLGNVVRPEAPADVDASSNYFDTVEGSDKQAEPRREAQRRDTPEVPAAPSATSAPDEGGPWYVQVHAGRDRRSVEELQRRLEAAGYRVKLLSEREGQGALYKVRVGGYATEAEARAAVQTLVAAGYSGAWVPPLDD